MHVRWLAVEIKSAKTVAQDFFATIETLPQRLTLPPGVRRLHKAVVYGGDEERTQHDVQVTPWFAAASLLR